MKLSPRTIPVPILAAAAALLPGSAGATRSDWTDAGNAQLRLLALPAEGGTIQAGVEITLPAGWHTYWRNPGDAGIPPQFDFSASGNVRAVDVRYPVPERFDDGTSVSAVYTDDVVFPVALTPTDAGSPVTLRVDASFGVCNEVCIPARAQAELTIPAADDEDALTKTMLAQASRRLPGPPLPGHLEVSGVAQDGSDALAIEVRMPDVSYSDLFVEGPQGWPLGQPKLVSRAGGSSRYRLSLAGRPTGEAVSGQTFRFVAVADSEAIEQIVRVP